MSVDTVVMVASLVLVFGPILGLIIYDDWYDSTDHSYIGDVARLSWDATIKKVEIEEVGSKGHRRFRTTVVFDDGFTYISHKTDIDDYRVFYKISLTPKTKEEIIQAAWQAHQNALVKREQKSKT